MSTKKTTRIIIKLHSNIELQNGEKDLPECFRKDNESSWKKFMTLCSGKRVRRLFDSVNREAIDALIEKAKAKAQGKRLAYTAPAFNNYFVINCPDEVTTEILTVLREFNCVERAYEETYSSPPPFIRASNNPRFIDQKYLDRKPVGIDAKFAWEQEGGDGKSNVRFIDIEQGWKLDHEDLAAAEVRLIEDGGGFNLQQRRDHGTSVLGVILAQDNEIGCVGIVPFVKARVVSQWRIVPDAGPSDENIEINTAVAILEAIQSLEAGDVILIEAQTRNFNPIEVESGSFDAISLGTNLDIIIIEAGGNGENNLDDVKDESGKFVFRRGNNEFRDSGAIIVGAATSGTHRKTQGSNGTNYGSRIDCYAWGTDINTTNTDREGNLSSYISDFSGTSGASAIIAGAVISIQSMHEKANGKRYSPDEMQRILKDTDCGTPSSNPEIDKIGLMPDLRKIFEKYIKGGAQP